MAKLAFIATVAVLLSAVAARDATVPDKCCQNQLLACRYKGNTGCVAANDGQYCVNTYSGEDCKDACRKLLGQPAPANNFYLYTVAGG
jgi:hypothetical protein